MEYYTVVVFSILFASSTSQKPFTKPYRGDYEYNIKTNAFYKLHIDTTTSQNANAMCGLEGAKILVPASKWDIAQVHGMMKQFPDIGAYVWVGDDGQDHEPAEEQQIIDLHSAEERSYTRKKCNVIHRRGEIETYTCYRHLPYVCKVEARDAVFDSQCQVFTEGYTYFASTGSCYKIPNLALTWDQAFAECKAEGAHLLVMKSQADFLAIKEFMKTAPRAEGAKVNHFFFAGFRANKPTNDTSTPRQFRTILNETLEEAGFAGWSPGEPNNSGGTEDCGCIFLNDGLFNDLNCLDRHMFICENEIHTVAR